MESLIGLESTPRSNPIKALFPELHRILAQKRNTQVSLVDAADARQCCRRLQKRPNGVVQAVRTGLRDQRPDQTNIRA